MKKLITLLLLLCLVMTAGANKKKVAKDLFPDGTPISEWFKDTIKVDVSTLGKQYVVTDYGVKTDSTIIPNASSGASLLIIRIARVTDTFVNA